MLVEDDSDLAGLLLKKLQPNYHLDWAANLAEAGFYWDNYSYELLVLDLSLPDGSGLAFCREQLTQRPNLAVLFLTADNQLRTRTACLAQFHSDFLVKPFSLKELSVRLALLTQKVQQVAVTSCYRYQQLRLDLLRRRCWHKGQTVNLTRKEFQILELLLKHQQQIVQKETLINQIWCQEQALVGNTLATHIWQLKRKLAGRYIKSIKGIGYCLE